VPWLYNKSKLMDVTHMINNLMHSSANVSHPSTEKTNPVKFPSSNALKFSTKSSKHIIYKTEDVEDLFHSCIEIINKPASTRSSSETNIVMQYLLFLSEFIKILKNANDKYFNELLKSVSLCLTHKFLPKNHILFKYGEKGNKFYIILKGKVAILVPRCEKVLMSEEEYVKYLLRLRRSGETEILNKCLSANKHIIPIDEDFDGWMRENILQSTLQSTHNPGSHNNSITFNRKAPIMSLINNSSSRRTSSFFGNQAILNEIKLTLEKFEQIQGSISHSMENTNHEFGQNNDLLISPDDYVQRINPKTGKKSFFKKFLMKILNKNSLTVFTNGNNMDDPESNPMTARDGQEEIGQEYMHSSNNKISSLQLNSQINEPKVLTIYKYYNVTTLHTGDKFGDIALDSKSQKRTATIITEDDTHFGLIDKPSYDRCLKEINDRTKRYYLGILLSYEIFNEFSKMVFEKNYYNFFKFNKLKRGEKLITEGLHCENIFFLKQGEFLISSKKSLVDISDLILFYREGKPIRCNSNNNQSPDQQSSNEKNNNLLNEKLPHGSSQTKQSTENEELLFYLEKRYIKLAIIKDRGIIGLDDCFYLQTDGTLQSVCNIECVSNTAEVYVISREFFSFILSKERVIRDNVIKFVNNKKKFFSERLESFKTTQIHFFKQKNNINKLKIKAGNVDMEFIYEEDKNPGSKTSRPVKVQGLKNALEHKMQFLKREETITPCITELNLKQSFINKSNILKVQKSLKHEIMILDQEDEEGPSIRTERSRSKNKLSTRKLCSSIKNVCVENNKIYISKQSTLELDKMISKLPSIISKDSEECTIDSLPRSNCTGDNFNRRKKINTEVTEKRQDQIYLSNYKTNIVKDNLFNNVLVSYISKESQNQVTTTLTPQESKIQTTLELDTARTYKNKFSFTQCNTLTSNMLNNLSRKNTNKHTKRIFATTGFNDVCETQTDVNVVDCLVMDKFQRIYNTLYPKRNEISHRGNKKLKKGGWKSLNTSKNKAFSNAVSPNSTVKKVIKKPVFS
jgi:CRP-like cAMP-binding protein